MCVNRESATCLCILHSLRCCCMSAVIWPSGSPAKESSTCLFESKSPNGLDTSLIHLAIPRANQQRELQRQQHETQQEQQQQNGNSVPSLPPHTSSHPTAQHPTHPITTPASSTHHSASNGVGCSSSSSAGASGSQQHAGQKSNGHTNGGSVGGVAGTDGANPSGLAGILARVNHHLGQILEGLPPRTLMMVVTGQVREFIQGHEGEGRVMIHRLSSV